MSALTTPDGQRIFYDTTGRGLPVLFVPGMLGNRRGLEARLATALSTRWQVITMDLRDSGESDPEPAYYTMDDLAGDVVSLLDALDIECAHVLGYSLGGMVALQLAIDHPARVDHLMLMSTFAHGEQGHRASEPLPPPAEWWLDDPVARAYASIPALVGPAYREQLRAGELAELAEGERDNRVTWPGCMRQNATQTGHDLRDRLGAIQAPTLVLHGDADPLVRLEHGEHLARRIPEARLHVMSGVGHLPWIERPEEVADAIQAFLGSVQQSP